MWADQRDWVAAHPEFIDQACEELSVQIPAGLVRVAEEFGEIVGFSALLPADDGSVDIDGLFVAPDHLRAGVGTALVADIVERMRRDGVERLTVLANPNALPFYERVGFRSIEWRATAFKSAMWMEMLIPSPASPA